MCLWEWHVSFEFDSVISYFSLRVPIFVRMPNGLTDSDFNCFIAFYIWIVSLPVRIFYTLVVPIYSDCRIPGICIILNESMSIAPISLHFGFLTYFYFFVTWGSTETMYVFVWISLTSFVQIYSSKVDNPLTFKSSIHLIHCAKGESWTSHYTSGGNMFLFYVVECIFKNVYICLFCFDIFDVSPEHISFSIMNHVDSSIRYFDKLRPDPKQYLNQRQHVDTLAVY